MSFTFFWLLLVLMIAGLPIAFALMIAPGISLFFDGQQSMFPMLLMRMYNGMDSFPLMAIPYFILAGEVMNRGGITTRLVRLSQALIGHLRGGLAHVNILSSILFAGLSGSAVADTSAIGSMLIPAMEKNGYTKRFSAAVTAASSVIGPIIPPSGIMIIYAFVMNVSVAGLFAAGLVPGLMVGFSLMGMTVYLSKKRNYPVASQRASFNEVFISFKGAILPLLTPIIILGGILAGIFTPTEAAAIAAGYAILISVFVLRTLKFKDIPKVLFNAALSSGMILFLVGASTAFATLVSLTGTAPKAMEIMNSISQNPLVLLFLVNLLLFFVGMFLDAGPAILILGPVLGPTFIGLGVDPLHFAIIMCVNVTVGLATPPMGLILFVAAGLSDEPVEKIAWEMLPFLAIEVIVIFLITFVEAIPMTLPRLLGFA
jgi:tripartite ATP-independent transporter DctM subunit|tara:strand:+ start:610 stop:1896 length:1287 start_codon:yes stop_codon:yes gene_type:complete